MHKYSNTGKVFCFWRSELFRHLGKHSGLEMFSNKDVPRVQLKMGRAGLANKRFDMANNFNGECFLNEKHSGSKRIPVILYLCMATSCHHLGRGCSVIKVLWEGTPQIWFRMQRYIGLWEVPPPSNVLQDAAL